MSRLEKVLCALGAVLVAAGVLIRGVRFLFEQRKALPPANPPALMEPAQAPPMLPAAPSPLAEAAKSIAESVLKAVGNKRPI
jgi:hypothetical protein